MAANVGQTDAPFRFLDLPAELRLMIYERISMPTEHHILRWPADATTEALPGEPPTIILVKTFPPVSILNTCHQIRAEAKPFISPQIQSTISLLVDARCLRSLFANSHNCLALKILRASHQKPGMTTIATLHKAVDKVSQDPVKYNARKIAIWVTNLNFGGRIEPTDPRWAPLVHWIMEVGHHRLFRDRHLYTKYLKLPGSCIALRVGVTIPPECTEAEMSELARDVRYMSTSSCSHLGIAEVTVRAGTGEADHKYQAKFIEQLSQLGERHDISEEPEWQAEWGHDSASKHVHYNPKTT